MKKKTLLASGLSLMMLVGVQTGVSADDDNDRVRLHEQLDDVTDVLEAVEIAREKFDGVIVDYDLDRDHGEIVHEFKMKNENNEFELVLDAITLDELEVEMEDEDDLDEEYLAKLNGETATFEEMYEATREIFEGSTLKEFELDESRGEYIFEIELIDENFKLEIDLYAEDLSVKNYRIKTHRGVEDVDDLKADLEDAIDAYDSGAVEATEDDSEDVDDLDDDNDDLDDDNDDLDDDNDDLDDDNDDDDDDN